MTCQKNVVALVFVTTAILGLYGCESTPYKPWQPGDSWWDKEAMAATEPATAMHEEAAPESASVAQAMSMETDSAPMADAPSMMSSEPEPSRLTATTDMPEDLSSGEYIKPPAENPAATMSEDQQAFVLTRMENQLQNESSGKNVDSSTHASSDDEDGHSSSWYPFGETSGVPRLPDQPLPYAVVPERPALPIEWGCKFLGKGNIKRASVTPWGAVWTPCLLAFGTFRTAVQSYESLGPAGRTDEWRSSLDMFFNLQLSQTEKCILGIGVLDDNDPSRFSGYGFNADNRPRQEGGKYFGPYNRAFFCEGDLGSLFPRLDPGGTKLIDYGFSFGRQQITFQEGIMINDVQDGFGLVRNNLHAPGFSNIRITGWLAWDNVDRGSPAATERLNKPGFFGVFTQADTPTTTWALDLATVQDSSDRTGGDGYWVGLAATQRAWSPWSDLGVFNTTYRANFSIAPDDDTPQMADGTILSAEISWTPHSSDDLVYVNPFWSIDDYTQAGREPVSGGPFAPLGISFASPALGNYLSELNAYAVPIVGLAVGYQAFWNNHRRNLIVELAGTKATDSRDLRDSAALTLQYQQAFGQRFQLQLDAFVNYLQGRDNGSGARIELLTQF